MESRTTQAVLDDIEVMYIEADGGTDGATDAMQELEGRLQSLKGRKFYGTFLNGQYRACVALQDDDSPTELGLKTWVIPGGKFARRRMENYMERIPEIGRTFQSMVEETTPDATRPSVEYYRRHNELILYLPTLS